MNDKDDPATLAYVKYVLSELSISPSALAAKIGISSTTLTRPLNNPSYKFNLSATTIEKIATFSGINPGPFFSNGDIVSMTLGSHQSYSPEYKKKLGLPDEEQTYTSVIGEVAFGVWKEISVTDEYSFDIVALRSSKYAVKDCYVLKLRGRQGGTIALPDDYLFCLRYDALDQQILPHMTVIVERRQGNGRLVELSLRQITKIKSGWQLTTMLTDTSVQHQVVLNELPGDDDARIVGVLLYVLRAPI